MEHITGSKQPLAGGLRVTKIGAAEEARPARVAAYCRVSTLLPEQQGSLDAQEAHYRKLIAAQPDWTLAGIYSDQGRSGTEARSREGLQRLLRDCREGRVDRILTKSISRFARNTAECLALVRELRSLNVSILFEKERIDTLGEASELLLTLLACFAEEESRSLSENVKWGLRKRFQSGAYRQATPPYGYRKGENGLVIDPEEAETVREIFAGLLSGVGAARIAEALNERGVRTRYGRLWSYERIRSLAENPVYRGDAVYQKTYMDSDFRQRSNDGALARYCHKGLHEPIVSGELFERANSLFDREERAAHEEAVFSGRVFCARCGCAMHRRTAKELVTFVCSASRRRLPPCGSKPVRKSELCRALTNLLNKLAFSRSLPQGGLVERYIAMTQTPERERQAETGAALARNRGERSALLSDAARRGLTPELNRRLRSLRAEEARLKEALALPAGSPSRLEPLRELLDGWRITEEPRKLPAKRFAAVLERLEVDAGVSVTFHFHGGLTLTESLRTRCGKEVSGQ